MTTNVHDYRFLLAERGTLERMLKETPPGARHRPREPGGPQRGGG